MSNYGYSYDLSSALDYFEKALVDRWQQTIYDVVLAMEPMPPTLQRYKSMGDKSLVWEHRSAEIHAHVLYRHLNGGCPYLDWFEGGRNGKVQSVTCDGKIWAPGDVETMSVYWQGATVDVPESTYCGIGELFAAAEDWAYGDRKYIFDTLPPFDSQNLVTLETARNALVEMAADFGAEPSGDGADDPAFQSGLTLSDDVESLFVDRDEEKDWRADWTGTTADRVAEGIFASTKPTLINHALIANGLGTLINERATIIHTYRVNSLDLIGAAAEALGEKSETTTDLTNGWKAVQGIGMGLALVPAAAPASAAISLVGWLGEQFLSEVKTVSFTHGPGEVAIALYDEVVKMNSALSTSEEDYVQDVATFRNALNEVPSTFLELYDITENSPTGTH